MKRGVVCSLFLSLLLWNTAAAENISTSFAAEPANKNALKPTIFLYEVQPGTTIEDEILIKNTSEKEKTLTIYAADGIKNDGKPVFKTNGEEMNEIGAWVGLESQTYTFEPQETKKLPFRVNIPQNAEERDYFGGFALEEMHNTGAPVQTALRVMKNIEIKVTQEPQEIPQFETPDPGFEPTAFFWITLGIFIISMGYVFLTGRKK